MAEIYNITLRLTEEQLREAINALDDLRDYDRTIDPELIFDKLDDDVPRLTDILNGLMSEYDRLEDEFQREVNMLREARRRRRGAAALANAPAPVNSAPIVPITNAMSLLGTRNGSAGNNSTRRNRRKSRKARKTRRS